MAYEHHPHGVPAGGPPPVSIDLDAMLAHSARIHDEGPENAVAPAPTTGYEGVYSSSFNEPGVLGPSAQTPQPVLPTELPPQAFLTSAMLLDFVDKKVNVVLRDDKTFVGILRSYDQYGNMVLTEVVERLFVKNPEYGITDDATIWLICDSYQGVLTIRGENVAVAGVVDLDQEDNIKHCTRAPEEYVRELILQRKTQKKADMARKRQVLRRAGLEVDLGMEG